MIQLIFNGYTAIQVNNCWTFSGTRVLLFVHGCRVTNFYARVFLKLIHLDWMGRAPHALPSLSSLSFDGGIAWSLNISIPASGTFTLQINLHSPPHVFFLFFFSPRQTRQSRQQHRQARRCWVGDLWTFARDCSGKYHHPHPPAPSPCTIIPFSWPRWRRRRRPSRRWRISWRS